MAAKPRAHEQKSRMRHWTQVPAGPGAAVRRSWERPRPRSQRFPLPRPSPAWPPASASLSLQPSGHPDAHPNMAWETDPPCGKQMLQPRERQRDMGRESNKAAKYLPLPTVVQDSLGLPTGLDRGSRGQPGAGAGPRDPVPAPLVACPPQEKSGNWPYFGHFSQRGSFSLMPRTFLNPALTTHPSKQPLIKQKEQREGTGGGAQLGSGRAGTGTAAWTLAAQPLLARSDRMDGQQAPELEVLDHRELLQALGLIHADETLVHFGPGGDSTDVP